MVARHFLGYITANQVTVWRSIATVMIIPIWVYGNELWQYLSALAWGICWYLDRVDGVMAREFGQASETGKWLDPLADKIQFYTTIAIFWDISNHLALGLLFVLDLFSTIERGWNGGKTKTMVGANWFGKWKTGFQINAFFLFVFSTLFSVTNLACLANVILWVSFLCSLTSIINRLHNLQNKN
jgi:CDP-diacylglycerol--glycerol-3-phosphate 3-phosphatidyltransferase